MTIGIDITTHLDPEVNTEFKATIIADHALSHPEDNFLQTVFLAASNIGWLRLKAAQAIAKVKGTSFMAPSDAIKSIEERKEEVIEKIIKNLIDIDDKPHQRYASNMEEGLDKVEKKLDEVEEEPSESKGDDTIKLLFHTLKFAWDQAGKPRKVGDTVKIMVAEFIPSDKLDAAMDTLGIKGVSRSPQELIGKIQKQITVLKNITKRLLTKEEQENQQELDLETQTLTKAIYEQHTLRRSDQRLQEYRQGFKNLCQEMGREERRISTQNERMPV